MDTGFIRKILMYTDIDQYFESAWRNGFRILSPETEALLIEYYGINKVKSIIEKYNLKVSKQKKSNPKPDKS
jgi:hypothetical protein